MDMKDNGWSFVLHAMQTLRLTLHSASGFAWLLKEDEYRPSLAEDERLDLLSRLEAEQWRMQRQVDTLVDTAHYSQLSRLERHDKVLVNQLCLDLAEEQDVRVLYKSNIPDFFAITTNLECLRKVLDILLRHAASRVIDRKRRVHGEPLVFLNVVEGVEKGKLVFSVTDTGDTASQADDIRAFDLPVGLADRPFFDRLELHNSWLLVRLLGGFIHIDPKYRNGRRVIFSIAT